MIEITDRQHIHILEMELFKYYPNKYIRKYLMNTNDIVDHKYLLKSISFDDDSIDYIVDLVVKDLKDNRRFKAVECVKILKRIIKNRKSQGYMQPVLVQNLFYLYQRFIFTGSDEIQWAVSVLIKDQLLDPVDIEWLIKYYQKSDHLLNRLLRYPECDFSIISWAETVYKNGLLADRQSEVIAKLIENDVPEYISVNSTILMWAIYYSKCEIRKKEELILKYVDLNDYLPALECAERLNLPSVTKTLLRHYRSKIRSNKKVPYITVIGIT